MRLLLVEDDTMIGEAVIDQLRAEHYAVDWVRDGEMALTALQSQTYDLVLLDLGLPRVDGLEVLRSLRGRKLRVPVLIATARDSVQQRVQGLDDGADDYILKLTISTSCWPASVRCCAARRVAPSRCTNTRVYRSARPRER